MDGAKGPYVEWQEVVVSNDKGRRVVHYYLKDAGGGADLAVVGREKSLRHMSYVVPRQFARSYEARARLLLPSLPYSSSSNSPPPAGSSFKTKWRSRREVIDWLSSLVPDPVVHEPSPTTDRSRDAEVAEIADLTDSKGPLLGKTGYLSKNFSWLGSSWICRKKRKHYSSFCKNGVTISVQAFVFIMAEENKRLIAYVEDLYEDMRAINMVVVRWFHKVDEVGFLLPPDTSDREIFFSLCLQDLSVECIDGLATVLSVQHFEQFQREPRLSNWTPYFCRRKIDNGDVKPFDITQLQGYKSQELLRFMFIPPLKLRIKIARDTSSLHGEQSGDVSLGGPKRKHMLHGTLTAARDKVISKGLIVSSKTGKNVSSNLSGSALIRTEKSMQQFSGQLSPGCHVEVLSQDSGMRGCWFHCVIIKRHQDKIKVRYLDIKDPDESGNLEEWILPSRVAAPDNLGIRLHGRHIVRPLSSHRGNICNLDVGAIVDAWWHDGWWEGIVIRRKSEGDIYVYFPGEKCTSVFCQSDLRQSQDWMNNKWNRMEDRLDIAVSLGSDASNGTKNLSDHEGFSDRALAFREHLRKEPNEATLPSEMAQTENTPRDTNGDIPDLIKDIRLLKLRWGSLKRTKCLRDPTGDASPKKRHCSGSQGLEDCTTCGGFVLPKSLTVDHDNCKIGGDTLFGSPMSLSNLVMSQ
ncbi:hypothetical protein Cni_G00616 [Canna indica]|uniref:BAH domain-containing protein n=1 Tax=Canna indica TaxID=4628 RepID=A0AAQ3JN15_9LILI|nr:hypothetical protein Cni_G00616 [Canna indica]